MQALMQNENVVTVELNFNGMDILGGISGASPVQCF